MNKDSVVREQIIYLLGGGGAHCGFEQAVADLPAGCINRHPPEVPHTPYRLVEHMRLAQWDILEFCRNPDHVSPVFPEGYWPAAGMNACESDWRESIESLRQNHQALLDLIGDVHADLYSPIPHGQGQTLLREALLAADHNAYHIGQLVTVRRGLGTWEE